MAETGPLHGGLLGTAAPGLSPEPQAVTAETAGRQCWSKTLPPPRNKHRMHFALKSLLQEAQNNLKIFKVSAAPVCGGLGEPACARRVSVCLGAAPVVLCPRPTPRHDIL